MNGALPYANTAPPVARRVSLALLLAFTALLPFDRFYSELALIGFALHTAIHFHRERGASLSRKDLIVLQSVFLVTVVSTIHTHYPAQAFSLWTRQLAIFLFPLLFAWGDVEPTRIQRPVLATLVLSCVVALLYCYVQAVRVLLHFDLPASDLLTSRFLNHHFSEPIGLHATYFSMYAALSALVVLAEWTRKERFFPGWLLALFLLVLLGGLVQLGSRSILIAFLLAGGMAFPALRLRGRPRARFLAGGGIAVLLLALAIGRTTALRHRLFTDLQADLAREKGSPMLGSRAERWTLAWDLVRERPLTGWGSGDEVRRLKERYFEERMYSAYLHDLNAHNQYLSFLVKSGIGGLLIYLLTLGYGFAVAIRRRNPLFTGFLLLIAVASVSENILDVNKGIFFYAFFFTLFLAAERGRGNSSDASGNRQPPTPVSTS